MGPNTDKKTVMKALVKNGMDVARFNFSMNSDRGTTIFMLSIKFLLRLSCAPPLESLLIAA